MAYSSQLITAMHQLLQQESIQNHQQLAELLKRQGFTVNQSTISRLLRKLGAMKGLNAKHEIVYLLPKEPRPSAPEVGKLVSSINHNEQLIVIQTSPGSANMIARLLDLNQTKCQILGTIAGDDTILVIPTSVKNLEKSLDCISDLISDHI